MEYEQAMNIRSAEAIMVATKRRGYEGDMDGDGYAGVSLPLEVDNAA